MSGLRLRPPHSKAHGPGNFCLLTDIDPTQVDQWYLGIYKWVELPNTRGMSQFADGCWMASKQKTIADNKR